ncbi:MAG: divalent metal cation transporter [Dehalococcoidia bacterium]|nr:divalent metal cation transporter [Dehalococcoidia bacterium]
MTALDRVLRSPVARARATPFLRRLALFTAIMGPGVITGIVDDDATGIAGYSLAGAKFGYSMIWALVLTLIALAVVQEMVARMGAVTGKGLADLIRERFGVRVSLLAMATLLVANGATTVAEFAGVAGASEIFGVSRYLSVPLAAVAVFTVVAYWSYRKVEIILLAVSVISGAYIITGFVAGPDWAEVTKGATVPRLEMNVEYLTILIGLIGTTITPWQMFYNQSSVVDKGLGEREVRFVSLDAYAGAFVTNLIAFFIILTAAATLWTNGQPASSVEDVAQALHPLAGSLAAELFAVGLLNAALMAMVVLPLSTAYAVCEAFGWERSLNRGVREAPVFFGLFGGLLAFGAAAVLIPGAPLLALLFLPNVVGGVLLPVILFLAIRLVNDRRLMGARVNSVVQNTVAVGAGGLVVLLSLAYLVVALLEAFNVVG